jgi:hypothetical protein
MQSERVKDFLTDEFLASGAPLKTHRVVADYKNIYQGFEE